MCAKYQSALNLINSSDQSDINFQAYYEDPPLPLHAIHM